MYIFITYTNFVICCRCVFNNLLICNTYIFSKFKYIIKAKLTILKYLYLQFNMYSIYLNRTIQKLYILQKKISSEMNHG